MSLPTENNNNNINNEGNGKPAKDVEFVFRKKCLQFIQRKYFKRFETLRCLADCKIMRLYYIDQCNNKITTCQKSQTVDIPYDHPIDLKGNIVAKVAYMKKSIMVQNISKIHEEYTSLYVDDEFKDYNKSLLCLPLLGANEECIAVILLIKKDNSCFSKIVLRYINEVCSWAGIALDRDVSKVNFQTKYNIFRKVLKYVVDYYSGEEESFMYCLTRIMKTARNAIFADKCFFYEFQEGQPDVDVYMGVTPDDEPHLDICMAKIKTLRFNKNSFVRNVRSTQKHLNETFDNNDTNNGGIRDPRLTAEICRLVNSEIRALLCVPIIVKKKVVAIIEFYNTWPKIPPKFSEDNELFILMIAKFLSSILYYKMDYKKLQQHVARVQSYEQLLSYRLTHRHIQQPISHITKKSENPFPRGFKHFSYFPDKNIEYSCVIYHIFMDKCRDLIQPLDQDEVSYFSTTCLKELVLDLCNMQRDNPYHNIVTTFLTFHFMFCLLKMIPDGVLTIVEEFSLLLACLIYNIDHKGLDYYCLQLTNDPILKMYDNHQTEQYYIEVGAFLLKRSKLIETLDSISAEEKKHIYNIITDTIMTTHYFSRNLDKFEKTVSKLKDMNEPHMRALILSFLVFCARNFRHAKSFRNCKTLCEQLYQEFYNLGDIGKEHNVIPLPRKDRRFADYVVNFEVEHLEKRIIPAYNILRKLFPSTDPIYQSIKEICKAYKDEILLKGKKCWKPDESIGLSY